jgi:hypothetical protein
MASFDFHLFENDRGWACVLPLTKRAWLWAMYCIDPNAKELAERFGTTALERGAYWFDRRDGLEVALSFMADGMTCARHERIRLCGTQAEVM